MNLAACAVLLVCQDGYTVRKEHPRLLIEDAREVARRCEGPLAEDWKIVKERADAAVSQGARSLRTNGWAGPDNLMNCALAALVVRAQGGDASKYVKPIVEHWGDGSLISNRKGSQFGFHALAYDWIFDSLTAGQRTLYGDALGSWLTWYTDKPEILLRNGDWFYNQTWGPSHLNIMHSRDALTQKVFIALAITGAGTKHEAQAKSFLDSWHRRVPAECLPAFEQMGGVWSESNGHGGYGPVTVIPWALHAWRTGTGIDLFKRLKPSAYPVEQPRWLAYQMMPHNERTAWIDDNNGARPTAFVPAAPMMKDPLSQWFSEKGKEWTRERWFRVASCDPSIKPVPPFSLPLGYLFAGAGHVYMRSAWKDPNATWAFFGCGPQFAGHSRDDEGHFLISRKGAVVSRQGGQGANDDDYYSGGSLIFNILTIFDPEEKFRRDRANENDGGLLRHVYETGPWPRERGRIIAFENAPQYTYAAADITAGYASKKAKEVTRQFLYLRGGARDYFVVFDRVEATKAEYRRHFFLHVPTEPERKEKQLSWLSLPEADGDREVLSEGRSRAWLQTVLPADAEVVTRGGPGKEAWGHPLEPTAQYNHDGAGRKRPPVCPWRIEVADVSKGARTLFLHVLEVANEDVEAPTVVRPAGAAGVDIGDRWQVRFNAEGPLGGTLDGKPLSATLNTAPQYK